MQVDTLDDLIRKKISWYDFLEVVPFDRIGREIDATGTVADLQGRGAVPARENVHGYRVAFLVDE